MRNKVATVATLCFVVLLAACGNGDGTISGGGGDTPPTDVVLQFGSEIGGTFQSGVLVVAPAQLSAGASATITGLLQYSDGTSFTGSAIVTFTSPCYDNGKAVFEINGTAGNIVATSGGNVAITYTANGCRGSDTINATTTVDSTALSAQGVVTVDASVLLGSGTGSSFQPGQLAIADADLPAGGSTTVSANLQYTDGTIYTGAATLTFTSACYQNGLASFALNGVPGNTVNANNGAAAITYTDKGCSGTDVVTATTTVLGINLTAQAGVTIDSGTGTVQFGTLVNGNFQSGILTVFPATLSAGDSATVSGILQNTDGTPYTGSVVVTFTSPCYQSGDAIFTINGATGNLVTTTTGTAQITYTASGCRGSDIVTATTSVAGAALEARGVVTVDASVLLGSGTGGNFVPGQLAIANQQLPTGGSTDVSANLQYTDGTTYTGAATLTFTSICYANGLASFSVNGVPGNTVAANNGAATITYTAIGCSGTDVVTATTVVEGKTLNAVGGLTVIPTVEFGSDVNGTFQSGVLAIAPSALTANGSATVSAVLQYTDGTPYIGSAIVTFTSPCYQSGTAEFSVGGTSGNVVTTTTGNVQITYTASGCRGADIITATTTALGNGLSATGAVTVAAVVELGSGTDGGFLPGALAIADPQIPLAGSTDISVTLQYGDGTLYTDPATLTFTSPCYVNGLATFTVNGVPGNTLTTASGQATITYTAAGCSGIDVIQATTTVLGDNLSAQGGVSIVSDTTTSVIFGYESGSVFHQGALEITTALLPVGGSTVVSGALQNTDGTPYTGVANVTFTSPCFVNGLANFTIGGVAGNVVTTLTGDVQITYTANGCRGSDIITATTSVLGTDLSATGVVTVDASVLLGSGTGNAFQSGQLAIANQQLAAGGSTNVTANLQYTDGTTYTGAATLTFTSPCFAAGQAIFAVNGIAGNTVAVSNGQAIITYTAAGCAGQDTITATTTVDANNLSAVGGLTVAPSIQLGSNNGGAFQQGVLALGVSNLSAGGSTSVTGILRYSDGTPYTGAATVTFISPCYQTGQAAFLVGGTATNSVTTTTGQATITYTAQGCSGADTITAQTMLNNELLTATGTVTVAPASIGSIEFVSVDPPVISLQGAGGQTTSTAIFQVTNASGGPVSDAHVTFELSTTVGGITLTPSSATSGSDGQVQTIVNAGTQHTTVRVTASTTTSGGAAISTQSAPIVIGTGLPSERAFTLFICPDIGVGAQELCNDLDPTQLEYSLVYNVESSDLDIGELVPFKVILSDRYNNPVPDGTTVAFTANSGQIDGSCTTTGNPTASYCLVTWTRANPVVTGPVQILAYTTGEESFSDANGNGEFDGVPPDIFTLYPAAPAPGDDFLGQPAYDDIGEVYLDADQSGSYDLGEFFFDFNVNGVRDVPDHTFHGIGCPDAAKPLCGNTHNFGVGIQSCLVMTTSSVAFTGPASVTIGDQGTFQVADGNGNVPPAGMTFSIVGSTAGVSVTLLQSVVPNIVNACESSSYPITVQVASTSAAGSFRIKAVSPGGTESFSDPITVAP